MPISSSTENSGAGFSHRLLQGPSEDDGDDAFQQSHRCATTSAAPAAGMEIGEYNMLDSDEEDGESDLEESDLKVLREKRRRYELKVEAKKERMKMLALEAEMKEMGEAESKYLSMNHDLPTGTDAHSIAVISSTNGRLQPRNDNDANDDAKNPTHPNEHRVLDVLHVLRAAIAAVGIRFGNFRGFAVLFVFAMAGTRALESLFIVNQRSRSTNSTPPPNALHSTVGEDVACLVAASVLVVIGAPDSAVAAIAFAVILSCLLEGVRDRALGTSGKAWTGKRTCEWYSIIVVCLYGLSVLFGEWKPFDAL